MKPIILNGDMVRAVLEGRKTQTRRLVKPQPVWVGEPFVPFKTKDADPKGIIKCPFGGPRDKLWVKETWAEGETSAEIYYRATDKEITKEERLEGMCWRPSIHMPRWASRITLEITDVRVERVNEISEEDAYAEGIDDNNEDYQKAEHFQQGGSPIETGSPATFAFKGLWDKLYPGSWQRGDWVWVISFKRG